MGEVIRFAQMCEPPLKAGDYRIQVEPVTNIDCKLTSTITDITVSTERFRLSPDQIYSVYPPREAVGSYSECLPHIVLNRRTLPWEKVLLENQPSMPWLALLVFDETEEIELFESNCGEALAPKMGTYIPSIELQPYENPKDPCTYVEVPVDLLSDILPYAQALSLLSHGKGVSLDDKVTDASVQDNWFATVVTNRFCLEPVDEKQTIRHIACLVSLEGYEELLENEADRQHALARCHTARMIVLANWSFSMSKAAFDFGSTFSTLDAGMMSTPYSGSNALIAQLSQLGYYPLNHHIRDGSHTVSWYQSPLIPYEEQQKKLNCVRFADQLLAYDPEIGMMDIRYSSAWQLGKAMALADQAYAQKLYAWRQANQLLARTSVYHGLLAQHLSEQAADHNHAHELGKQFIHAARANNEESSQSSGKQILLQQLQARYHTLLGEVIADASKE